MIFSWDIFLKKKIFFENNSSLLISIILERIINGFVNNSSWTSGDIHLEFTPRTGWRYEILWLCQYLTTFQRMNCLVIRKCALKSWVEQLLKLNHVEHYQLLWSTFAVALGEFCVSSFLGYSNFSRVSGRVLIYKEAGTYNSISSEIIKASHISVAP